MKELYDKTDREKFEIIGIVGDSLSDVLKDMIEKDSISSWIPNYFSCKSRRHNSSERFERKRIRRKSFRIN